MKRTVLSLLVGLGSLNLAAAWAQDRTVVSSTDKATDKAIAAELSFRCTSDNLLGQLSFDYHWKVAYDAETRTILFPDSEQQVGEYLRGQFLDRQKNPVFNFESQSPMAIANKLRVETVLIPRETSLAVKMNVKQTITLDWGIRIVNRETGESLDDARTAGFLIAEGLTKEDRLLNPHTTVSVPNLLDLGSPQPIELEVHFVEASGPIHAVFGSGSLKTETAKGTKGLLALPIHCIGGVWKETAVPPK